MTCLEYTVDLFYPRANIGRILSTGPHSRKFGHPRDSHKSGEKEYLGGGGQVRKMETRA